MIDRRLKFIADFCSEQLLDEKWLVGPSLRVVNQWKEQIAFSDQRLVNLHAKTVRSIVLDLVTAQLDEDGKQFASGVLSRLFIRKILAELHESKSLEYFGTVRSIEAVADLAARSVEQFRLAGLGLKDVSPSAWEEPAKAADFSAILKRYIELLEKHHLTDYAGCIELLKSKPAISRELQGKVSILIPNELELHRAESDLVDLLDSNGLVISFDDEDTEQEVAPSPKFFAAIGEVNEVRAVMQKVLGGDAPTRLDSVELLHTDYETYVPLVHEYFARQADDDLSIDAIPVTFAEGIACIYSRPGRALRSWLRWLRNRCLQPKLVQMIREGLLSFEFDEAEPPSNTRLSDALRKISIGMDRERYVPKLSEAIAIAEQNIAADKEDGEDREFQRDYGLPTLIVLRRGLEALIELSPLASDGPISVLKAAKRFLQTMTRASSKLDRYARQKLVDEIDGMLEGSKFVSELELDVWTWLEDLPVTARILASGPKPGCIHVDHLMNGGHSGREQLYIIGLDDGRFPKRGYQDPLILDVERKLISSDLPTSEDYNRRCVTRFRELTNDPSNQLCVGYATRSLKSDRLQFISPTLLELFRNATEQPVASAEDYLRNVGEPVSFASADTKPVITRDEWWASRLLGVQEQHDRTTLLEGGFEHFADGRAREVAIQSSELTGHDGYIPKAGEALDPTVADQRASPSRLETLGKCPRKFFFKYGLKIYPPDELVLDKDRWIDPLVLGSLVHGVFETFLADLTSRDQIPNLERDHESLLRLMRERIEELKNSFPIPNEDAYRRQVSDLEKTCEIFLRAEEEYCAKNDARPWVLEAAIGLKSETSTAIDCDEPIGVGLSDGRRLLLSGQIDRIDRVADSNSLIIWDYKTGSSYGYDLSDPFQKGTKLQSYLYVGMLRHRARQVVGEDAEVLQFGYFFPSPRSNGRRIYWTTGKLKTGDAVLRQVCDVIAAGTFLGTIDAGECRYCDYRSICGDPTRTVARSEWLLKSGGNESLNALRALKEVVTEGGQ